MTYILKVNGRNAGEINIPKDQFLKDVSYDKTTKVLKFTFETSSGDKETKINLSDLADMYSAGNGIKIENGVISCTYVIPTKVSELINDAGYISEIPSEYITENEMETAIEDKADKSEIPSLDGYATEQWVEEKKYLSEHQDISGKLDVSVYEVDKETFATKSDLYSGLNEKQDKGDYALKSELPDVSDMLTKTEASSTYQVKGEYLTEVPSEYITETELASAIENKVDKSEIPSIDNLATKTALEGVSQMAIQTANDVDVIEETLEKTVQFDVLEESYGIKNRKVITFDNGELIQSRANTEELEGKIPVNGSVPLIQLSRWNVVDLGSTKTITNINTPKGYRPTVQEEGQSGLEANQIAYVSDVEGVKERVIVNEYNATAQFDMLNTLVNTLTTKVDNLRKTNTEIVSVEGVAPEMTDASKDYIVNGNVTEVSKITAKTLAVKDAEIESARLIVDSEDVNVKDTTITGSYPITETPRINTMVWINKNKYINFKDVVFNPSDAYNAVEIGSLDSEKSALPISIVFDNCDFTNFNNNVINIFGTDDNAVITINNCHFGNVSNCLRLSNRANAKNVVINVNNCTVDQWYENEDGYAGFLMCQDYTSQSIEAEEANNLFGDGKIIVNFNNLIYKGSVIKPENAADVCGSKDSKQVVYVYYNKKGLIDYSANTYPVVKFN